MGSAIVPCWIDLRQWLQFRAGWSRSCFTPNERWGLRKLMMEPARGCSIRPCRTPLARDRDVQGPAPRLTLMRGDRPFGAWGMHMKRREFILTLGGAGIERIVKAASGDSLDGRAWGRPATVRWQASGGLA